MQLIANNHDGFEFVGFSANEVGSFDCDCAMSSNVCPFRLPETIKLRFYGQLQDMLDGPGCPPDK